jgi:hypothetical protein
LLLPSGPPPSWLRVSLARGLIGRTTVHLELSDLPLETAAAVLALLPNREEVPEPEEEPAEATP